MALLQKLKSLFGFADGDPERGHDRDVGITVEQERGSGDAAALEGVGADDVSASETPVDAAAVEPTAPTGEAPGDATAPDATTPEAAESDASADDAVESDASATEAVDSGASADADPEDGEPVDSIKGIGPAYAERLAEAGVGSVRDLAAADADALEAETGISATRIRGWIDRANAR